jgi:hypothetical protein
MSKGSKQRPCDKDKFNDSFDKIFGVKKVSGVNDAFWVKQGCRLVDGAIRNQVWVNNQAWINPDKFKELEPSEHKKLDDMGCYKS